MVTRKVRNGSDSRCCNQGDAPYEWAFKEDSTDASVQALDGWLDSLAPFARAHEIGEISELMDAAANGLLFDSNDELTPIKPIHTHPDVFELRRKALSKVLRFYHAEPACKPHLLLRVHRHLKSTHPPQQDEIEKAVARYSELEASCVDCSTPTV